MRIDFLMYSFREKGCAARRTLAALITILYVSISLAAEQRVLVLNDIFS